MSDLEGTIFNYLDTGLPSRALGGVTSGRTVAPVAEIERDGRRKSGTALLGAGAFTLASRLYLLRREDDDRTVGWVALATGAASLVGGSLALVIPREGERLHARFGRALAEPSADQARVVAETELRLFELPWRTTGGAEPRRRLARPDRRPRFPVSWSSWGAVVKVNRALTSLRMFAALARPPAGSPGTAHKRKKPGLPLA